MANKNIALKCGTGTEKDSVGTTHPAVFQRSLSAKHNQNYVYSSLTILTMAAQKLFNILWIIQRQDYNTQRAYTPTRTVPMS